MGKKSPKSKLFDNKGKKPKQIEKPIDKRICWLFSNIELDRNSDWNWSSALKMEKDNKLLEKVREYETMKLSEVQNKINHRVSQEALSKEARRCLEKKKLNDFECLHSFHVTGGIRFYCIPDGNRMKLLWYDEYHSDKNRGVCPSIKKHT